MKIEARGELSPGVGTNYALKLQHTGIGEGRIESFEQEMDFLEDAEHGSILPYHDSGIFDGNNDNAMSTYIIVEYLPNTLEEVILADRASITEKLNYALQLTAALSYIHNLDDPIIHRDIKPSNIFVRQNDCFLGDFGMMKRKNTSHGNDPIHELSDVDHPGVVENDSERAIPYMYPTPDLVRYEREEEELKPESDIFQLGIVLTELFSSTNQNPIIDVEKRNPLDDVHIEEVNNVSGTIASDDIEDLLGKMLRQNPEERIEHKELLDEWENLLNGTTQMQRNLNGKTL